jgi:spore germination cell wall hydrolase CwlJ-like protein
MVNTNMENWKKIEDIDLDNLVLNIVDDDLVEEGVGKLVSYGLLAFLLGSAGIVEGAALDANMEKLVRDKQVQQGGKVTITKTELKDVIERSKKKSEKVGKWDLAKAKNLLARTLYMESREDGEQGLNLTMTVIWNRAAGMKDQFVPECIRPSQFSCWNDTSSSEKNPTTYQIQFPSCVKVGKGADFDMWNKCVEIANSAYAGSFVPVDSHWNAYYNPKKCHPSWATQLMNSKTVGHHIVGELKDQTRHAANLKKNQKTKMYVVQPGDTLWKIAGKDMNKVNQLKELNNLKSDSIHPGMQLKLA